MALAAFDLSDFASSSDDANARFETHRSADPFPDIAPALLNTADFLSYVAATGMIYPFSPDPNNPERMLKPASCAIPVGGEYVYWTTPESPAQPDPPKRIDGSLEPGGTVVLERNSIVFLSLAPMFRMPDYLAARYNLKIRQIYRGILVGTGPLVDPGFVGRLSIPLHNLTANDYEIGADELLVWMEFTKLSPNERWTPKFQRTDRNTSYVAFPPVKNQRETVRDYVRAAFDGPIQSSIPALIGRAEKSATDAASHADALGRRFTWFGIGSFVVILLAVGALVVGGYAVVEGALSADQSVRASYQQLQQQVAVQRQELSQQASEIRALQRR